MPPRDKPRHRSGYSREETEQVEAACLTVAVTLGALMDRLCIVGGLVPSLLIDRELGPEPETGAGHPGTNDLDVGLAVALLDDKQYTEIGERLRREGFEPDRNEQGNPTPQRWKLDDLDVSQSKDSRMGCGFPRSAANRPSGLGAIRSLQKTPRIALRSGTSA